MVKIDDELHARLRRIAALLRGRAEPQNPLERDVQEGNVDTSEHAEKEYGGFGLTLSEMRQAVDAYQEWLDDVREEIADEELRMKQLEEDIEYLQGEERRNAQFDLQLSIDRLDELVDERDEVEAKLQTVRRELNIVEREVRRDSRQKREPIDWATYDAEEQRERRREKKKERQKEQQSVRKARRDQKRRTTEQPDMSGVERVLGEDRAREMEEKMTDEWEVDNNWIEEDDEDEKREPQERSIN